MTLGHTMKNYKKENLMHDVITGIIIMAVSIPISMGYSQIAGIPAVYGLYGSVFPIILFALFSTSPQFIFGVDAAPAALVGSALLGMNIQSGSKEALAVVPVITFFVAVWLIAFYLMHAGKLVNYISAPVMGGFITGICSTIILMQVPKLMGGTAGTGELLELLEHIEKNSRTDQSSVTDLRDCFTCYLIGSQKDNAKIPNGSSDDGSRSSHDTGFADERMGNQDIGCSITRTSKMEFS